MSKAYECLEIRDKVDLMWKDEYPIKNGQVFVRSRKKAVQEIEGVYLSDSKFNALVQYLDEMKINKCIYNTYL